MRIDTELLEYILNYRVINIRGRLGFGKTALACSIAHYLLWEGYVDGVITNFPTVFPISLNGEDDNLLINKCLIFDEAWMFLDSRRSMSNDRSYGAFARKFGNYILFPSVHPVDKRMRAITISPAWKNIITGNDVWEYIVSSEAEPVKNRFPFKSNDAWGKYSTEYVPINDGGINQRFKNTMRYWTDDDDAYDKVEQNYDANKEYEQND